MHTAPLTPSAQRPHRASICDPQIPSARLRVVSCERGKGPAIVLLHVSQLANPISLSRWIAVGRAEYREIQMRTV